MASRSLIHLLLSSFSIFIHDIFQFGNGFYIITMLFFWRAIVWLKRAYEEERQDAQR